MRAFLPILLLFCGLTTRAACRNQAEALTLARGFVMQNSAFCSAKLPLLQLVNVNDVCSVANTSEMSVTLEKGSSRLKAKEEAEPSFYVYNVGEQDGFVVVSSDDCFSPILGYSAHGHIEANSILPDGLRYWLGFLDAEMKAAKGKAHDSHVSSSDDLHESIAPLLTTKWDQKTPFNNLIPTFATGCVATAVAQVMRFWSYPAHGTGSHTNAFFTQYTVDFSSATYDWANMKDEYGSKRDSREQVNAVATLMYHLGVATDMRWSANDSATPNMYAAYALTNFFGYNPNLHSETRDHLSPSAWRELLIEQLSSGHPVCYAGMTSATSGEGHFFVCDGYDAQTGMFHFNWGWGGRYDSYFNLSALNPLAEGEAGALTGSFNYAQQIFVDVQPTQTGSYVAHFDCRQVFPVENTCATDKVLFRTREITNNTLTFQGTIGMTLYAPDGSLVQYVPSQQTFPGPLGIGKVNDADYDICVDLSAIPDGTYTACLSVLDNQHPTTPYPVRAHYSETTYYEATIQHNAVSFRPLENTQVIVGVNPITASVKTHGSAYNLRGQRLSQSHPLKGIYVEDGKVKLAKP